VKKKLFKRLDYFYSLTIVTELWIEKKNSGGATWCRPSRPQARLRVRWLLASCCVRAMTPRSRVPVTERWDSGSVSTPKLRLPHQQGCCFGSHSRFGHHSSCCFAPCAHRLVCGECGADSRRHGCGNVTPGVAVAWPTLAGNQAASQSPIFPLLFSL
jgi:hypothetical protein